MKNSNRYRTRYAAKIKKKLADAESRAAKAEQIAANAVKNAAKDRDVRRNDDSQPGYAVVRNGRDARMRGKQIGMSVVVDVDQFQWDMFSRGGEMRDISHAVAAYCQMLSRKI